MWRASPGGKARLYERRHEPRWDASAWLPTYPPGAAEPVWTYRTFQSFQVSQYCQPTFGR